MPLTSEQLDDARDAAVFAVLPLVRVGDEADKGGELADVVLMALRSIPEHGPADVLAIVELVIADLVHAHAEMAAEAAVSPC